MATVDHRKLDAYHRARMEIAVALERFKRRIYDEAKTAIDADIQKRLVNGEDFDGSELGREATLRVIAGYVGEGEPQGAIEAGAASNED